ncbi:CRISPR-associated endonuclease Cas3'' [Desulfolithobacter sp.]
MKYYAHSLEGKSPENWQELSKHLKNVAEMAADFARPFGGEDWAYLAGLWHDLGKYSDSFQKRLYDANGIECHIETQPGKVVHSEAGGHLATLNGWKGADRVLSWLIMGHHAGLTDYEPEYVGAKALSSKMSAIDRSVETLANVPEWIRTQALPPPPEKLQNGADPSFFIRMLFSCLVDADFLDTEAFMDQGRAALRSEDYPGLGDLLEDFDAYMDLLCKKARQTPVNTIRAEILARCRQVAEQKPSVFSLTVPTGGGKTLASLAFALRHAVKYEKSRIIYVIPYTSIIEQTAKVFGKIPGFEKAVVEHHCNIAETGEDRETARSRLSAENWDAPLIVTTSVQFFESLYACRSSRCRKLHNIANSVVIFDEAQCLPPEYLRPVVFAIRELQKHYRVTPLLCTATQPALNKTESFDFRFREGFDSPPQEIVDNPDELAARLKRVEVVIHEKGFSPVSLPELAEDLQAEKKALLCIVNRRDDARDLARLLPEGITLHLSTNMCAAHRLRVMDDIRTRLNDGEGIKVISTSLVEAGVDLDFPVVYRALSGLDSIAQAAGRCNREGKLTSGRTVVFMPEKQPGYVRLPAGIASEILKDSPDNMLSPGNYEKYFRHRFWLLGEQALDRKGIMPLFAGRMNYYYRTAAERFRLIDDDWQVSVLAPWDEAVELLGRLTSEPWNQRMLLRRLGRYSVGIPQKLFAPLAAREYVRESGYPGLYLLDNTLYDKRYGFVPPDEATDIDPEQFMI